MTSRSTPHVAAGLADPSFPRLHPRPGRGWLNDPHGCIEVDGRYHVFFQHNPDSPYHQAMKWGHLSSPDLAHWHEEPIALYNRPGEHDAFGCWTGSITDHAGVPTIAYSAVANESEDAVVLLARSDREMRNWQQDRDPVCGTPEDPAVTHARDPFLLEFEGRRFAVQGAGNYAATGAARVLVYDCDDLTAWTELGPLITVAESPLAADIAPAHVWECPNLFPLGERWVLIVCLWSRIDGGISAQDVRYLVGDLKMSPTGPRFHADAGGLLDRGPAFYAPQVLREHERTLIFGWAREHGRPQADIDVAGWAGTLTFCRQLRLLGDQVISEPAVELEALRRDPLDIELDEPFAATAFEIQFGDHDGAVSLWLTHNDGEQLVTEFDVTSSGATEPRLYVDGSIIEVFDGSGLPLTTRAYPTATSTWKLRCESSAEVAGWHLGPDRLQRQPGSCAD